MGHPDHLHSDVLNYVGVALAVVALGMYTMIKTGSNKSTKAVVALSSREISDALFEDQSNEPAEPSKKSGRQQVVGITFAVLAGVMFGNTFTPPDYIRLNQHGPTAPLDYVFSHFIGIFATSTLWCVPLAVPPLSLPLAPLLLSSTTPLSDSSHCLSC